MVVFIDGDSIYLHETTIGKAEMVIRKVFTCSYPQMNGYTGSNPPNWREHDLNEFSLKKMSKLMYLAIHFSYRKVSVIT